MIVGTIVAVVDVVTNVSDSFFGLQAEPGQRRASAADTDDTNNVLSAVRDMVLSSLFEDDDMLRRRIFMILASGP